MTTVTGSSTLDGALKKGLGELIITLPEPAKGYVTWFNNTDEYIDVQTFDEKDAVRWIAYETRRIAPKQSVRLTARGEYIHIYVGNNQSTYDCDKNKTYLFDGANIHLKP